jgi:aspartate racemase
VAVVWAGNDKGAEEELATSGTVVDSGLATVMMSGPAAYREVSSPLVGILGGMGPAATVDFYGKLVCATPATSDQEHVRVIIWADPTVPDRSAALLGDGPDPTPHIEQGARALVAAGADLIAVPCNTAHAFLPGIAERIGVPIVHMIEETVRYIVRLTSPVDHVGLLATRGTRQAGLYQNWLHLVGKHVVLPNEMEQEEVMRSIRAIKSGDTGTDVRARVAGIAEALATRGAQVLIAGCTEIPLVLKSGDIDVPVVDPTLILAKSIIARLGGGDRAGPVGQTADPEGDRTAPRSAMRASRSCIR